MGASPLNGLSLWVILHKIWIYAMSLFSCLLEVACLLSACQVPATIVGAWHTEDSKMRFWPSRNLYSRGEGRRNRHHVIRSTDVFIESGNSYWAYTLCQRPFQDLFWEFHLPGLFEKWHVIPRQWLVQLTTCRYAQKLAAMMLMLIFFHLSLLLSKNILSIHL